MMSSAKSNKSLVNVVSKLRAVTEKNAVLKMFKRKANKEEEEGEGEVQEEEEQQNPGGVIWDKELQNLALKEKDKLMIGKEIGWKSTRIIPPTPDIFNVAVKRKDGRRSEETVLVLKPARSHTQIKKPRFTAPRFDALGNIVPHSILGDVESFLAHAAQRREFPKTSNVLLVHGPETGQKQIPEIPEKTAFFYTKHVNQNKALAFWNKEMKSRRNRQKKLAAALGRGERELLMCKSDLSERRRCHAQSYGHCIPANVGFWKLPVAVGGRQIHETFPHCVRGYVHTPETSGDADRILKEKGKFKPRRVEKQEDNLVGQGKIEIANRMLFDELDIQGLGVSPPVFTDAGGDNMESRKAVTFYKEESTTDAKMDEKAENPRNIYSSFFSVKKESKPLDYAKKIQSLSPGEVGITAVSTRKIVKKKGLAIVDRVSRPHGKRGGFDFKITEKEKEQVDVPALFIDGMIIKWWPSCDLSNHGNKSDGNQGNINDDNPGNNSGGNHGNNSNTNHGSSHGNNCNTNHGNNNDGNHDIIKEVFILMEGKVGKVVQSFAKIENIGRTSVRYYWMKKQDKWTLPIPNPRPPKQVFHFFDDDGVILPRETVLVPMLFHSNTAGFFRESWILGTVPPLMGGAKVKFTFTGMTLDEPKFVKEITEIKNYLMKNEARTMQEYEVRCLVDYASLEGSLKYGRLVEEPPPGPSPEEKFMGVNPGMYYHGDVVARLTDLYKSFVLEKGGKGNAGHVVKCRHTSTVSLARLRKEFLALSEAGDKSQVSLNHQQMLLQHLFQDVDTLMFRPLVPQDSMYQYKYNLVYSMLQTAVDQMVDFSFCLADRLGFVPKKKVVEEPMQEQSIPDKNKGKHSGGRSSKLGKKRGSETPEVQGLTSPNKAKSPGSAPSRVGKRGTPEIQLSTPAPEQEEGHAFSIVHSYRTDDCKNKCAALRQYDEKVHLQVYSILVNTIEEITNLFDYL